ncbi:MAG: ATP:cob(I)alamin adenosyltransferase [Myxococcales bacterium]|nr:ATP:cob(I)alamin adenosyltransferase [Myxococcales bacterium]
MVRLNKIYTRKGDDGSTGLVDGSRVRKDDPRVVAYGSVDELSANLGVVHVLLIQNANLDKTGTEYQSIAGFLVDVQQDLFDLGSQLATPEDSDIELPSITDDHVAALETELDRCNENLEPLASFILPGGNLVGAQLHVSRTVCRRAERCCVSLPGVDEPGRRIVRYLNRLSDLLFVWSRWVHACSGTEDLLWKPGQGTVKRDS